VAAQFLTVVDFYCKLSVILQLLENIARIKWGKEKNRGLED
jgi:hypothetical protein